MKHLISCQTGVYRGKANIRVHFRRPHEDKVVAHVGERTPGTRAEGGGFDVSGSTELGTANQKHHEAGHHPAHYKLP